MNVDGNTNTTRKAASSSQQTAEEKKGTDKKGSKTVAETVKIIQDLSKDTNDILAALGDKLEKGDLSPMEEQLITNAFADRSRLANFTTNMYRMLHDIAESIIRNMRP